MPIKSLLRDYRVGPTSLAFVVFGLAAWGLASITIPTFNRGAAMHVWTLAPSIAGSLSIASSESQLKDIDWIAGRSAVVSRVIIFGSVLAVALLTVIPTATSVDRPDMIESTALLIASSFGATVIVGNGASILGAANVAIAMVGAQHFANSDLSLYLSSRWPAVAAVASGVCGGAYCILGARAQRLHH